MTFDGNTNLKQKVTFSRIKQHLETVYKRKFSFGSVVQLCVARNKRRRSANRYNGVAQVTRRRARKGFQLGTTQIPIGVAYYTEVLINCSIRMVGISLISTVMTHLAFVWIQ